MYTQWFYNRDGRVTLGPVTWQELTRMAAAGELLPSDLVGPVGMARPVRAGAVAGLFPQDGTPVAAGQPSGYATRPA